MVDLDELDFLQKLAAASIRFGFDHAAPLHASPRSASAALRKTMGSFISLQVQGRNRGCQGDTVARYSLFDSVRLAAFRSAFKDRRFTPVTPALFDTMELQVHVLSAEQQRVPVGCDLLAARHPQDSVLLRHGDMSAFYLSVVCEKHKSNESLVTGLREKAGISVEVPDADLRFFFIRTQCGKKRHTRDIQQDLNYEW